MGEVLNRIAEWAVSLMSIIGAPGAGIAIALENLFPPLPSELILPLAGYAAARGEFSLISALLWTTLGSVFGALILYGLGAWLGRERMYWIAEKLPLIDTADVAKTERWFAKYGTASVLFGRMLPLFRSFISIPAGIERMPLGKFTLLTFVGSAIWNTIFVVAGYVLGANWEKVLAYSDALQYIVIFGIVAGLIYFLVRKLQKRGEPST